MALSQPFQLFLKLLLCFLGLGFHQCSFKILDLFVEVVLPLCKFSKPIHHLPSLTLCRWFGRIRFLFHLVPILIIIQFQLIDLLLAILLSATFRRFLLLLLRLNNLVLTCSEPQQPLIGFTFFTECTAQGHQIGINRRSSEHVFGSRHCISHLLKILFRLSVLNLFSQFVGHFKRVLLRLNQELGVIGKRFADRLGLFASNHIPCSTNDLLLKLGQLLSLLRTFTLLLLLLLFLLFRRHAFTFAENFFKGTYLGKEHVAIDSPSFPIAVDILSPKIVAEQLIGLGLQCFHIDQVRELYLSRFSFADRNGHLGRLRIPKNKA